MPALDKYKFASRWFVGREQSVPRCPAGFPALEPGWQLSELCGLPCTSCPLLELHLLTALLLQGAHVTINARAEEDVEPECIMQKVARASGANYAFHRESGRFQDTGPQAPVVSAAWAGGRAGAGRECAVTLSHLAAPALGGLSLTGLGSWLPGFQPRSQMKVQMADRSGSCPPWWGRC